MEQGQLEKNFGKTPTDISKTEIFEPHTQSTGNSDWTQKALNEPNMNEKRCNGCIVIKAGSVLLFMILLLTLYHIKLFPITAYDFRNLDYLQKNSGIHRLNPPKIKVSSLAGQGGNVVVINSHKYAFSLSDGSQADAPQVDHLTRTKIPSNPNQDYVRIKSITTQGPILKRETTLGPKVTPSFDTNSVTNSQAIIYNQSGNGQKSTIPSNVPNAQQNYNQGRINGQMQGLNPLDINMAPNVPNAYKQNRNSPIDGQMQGLNPLETNVAPNVPSDYNRNGNIQINGQRTTLPCSAAKNDRKSGSYNDTITIECRPELSRTGTILDTPVCGYLHRFGLKRWSADQKDFRTREVSKNTPRNCQIIQ